MSAPPKQGNERTIGEKGLSKSIWIIVVILSLVGILVSVFFMVISDITFDVTMENTGSSLTWESLDEVDKVAIRFLVARPFWDEILFGIWGLFCAWGLKKRESFAWKCGVFWSLMLIASGIIISFNEIVVSGWAMVCMLPISLLVVGFIALVCLLRVKKGFAGTGE